MTALEQLEKKTGRLYTAHDHVRVREKAAKEPATLSDTDLLVLDHFAGPRTAAEARAAREQSQQGPIMTDEQVRAIVRGITPAVKAYVREQSTAAIRDLGADALADVVVETIKKAIEPLKARIAELEARSPGCEYKGTFTQGTTYAKGSLVTRNGGMWLALNDTGLAPGSHPTLWKLVVKEGHAR